ncbi:hypothetical protein ABIC86_005245 [Paenibacillus sp. DS2363]|nr:hypothetical protein PAEAM_31280 [Paenibacillus sp. GM1FR]
MCGSLRRTVFFVEKNTVESPESKPESVVLDILFYGERKA